MNLLYPTLYNDAALYLFNANMVLFDRSKDHGMQQRVRLKEAAKQITEWSSEDLCQTVVIFIETLLLRGKWRGKRGEIKAAR